VGSCSEIPDQTMKSDDGGSWHDPYIWSTNQVPTYCFEVSIEGDLDILIEDNHIGHAKSIDVSNNVNFTVLGELNVLPGLP